MNAPILLAERIARLQPSPIREILAVASQDGMISFAGGLPSFSALPNLPVSAIDRTALQYGPTDGELALRRWVADDLQCRGLDVNANRVIVLSGSQQGIDLVGKLAVDVGTPVAVESPTYLAALQVFSLFGAQYLPYTIDTLDTAFIGASPALLYCNPTFQNPSSHVYSADERRRLAGRCDELGAIVFEDDPYRELDFNLPCSESPGGRLPVVSHLQGSSWVYQSSFSKTLAPGLRLGYLTCSEDLYQPLLRLKQAADLHASRVSQRIVLELLTDPAAAGRMADVRDHYRDRRDRFDAALRRHFSDIAIWKVPTGGLFFWLELQCAEPVRTFDLLPKAIEAGVTFMPGEPFFASGVHASSCLRLSFGNADPDSFDQGLSTLAAIVRQSVACRSAGLG